MIAKCKFLILSVVSICLLTLFSCRGSMPTYIYEYEDEVENNESAADTSFLMFVNEQSFFSQAATRGTGAFDNSFESNKAKLNAAEIYVFAFRDSRKVTDMPETVDFSRSAYSGRNGDAQNESCLLDGEDYNHGMLTRLSQISNGMLIPQYDGVDFSKAEKSYVGYNFFAYYLDDLQAKGNFAPNRTSEKIWYDIEIDGSQDILCGAAPTITQSVLNSKIRANKLSIPANEQKTIVAYKGYSKYAARRGVYPVIDMQHVFTRLVFTAYPYNENANNIHITGISVKTPYKGSLTVAARSIDDIGFEITNVEDSAELFLREPSVDGLKSSEKLTTTKVSYDSSEAELDWSDRTGKRLGESLLLPPAESYLVTVYTIENGADVVKTYTISAPKKKKVFNAGSIYNIKIAVGKQETEADEVSSAE